ncbi:MAG: hypothetical protein A2Z71_05125 [Chloroflexi bacterium RBG_13_50_21]|nr:MAG: hypothetical protein A2Z71_05125 [Chloroflexi bacterium RBG_13_50_21]
MIMYIGMERLIRLFRLYLVCLFLMVILFGTGSVHAADVSTGGIERKATIAITYTRYEWWLLRWSNNQIQCQVYVDHEGWPTAEDVLTDCGGTIYNQWINTQPCTGLDDGQIPPSGCTGLYLYFIGSAPAEKAIEVDLPPSLVYLSLSGCSPIPPENLCPTVPSLHFEGEEPLPNEQISAIHVKIENVETTCQGGTCDVQLQPTRLAGSTIEFWADSSFGDSSAIFSAMVRVIDSGVAVSPTSGGWYVDIISSQWQGSDLATCSQVWQAFPPVGGVPDWLSTPEDAAFLATEQPYSYLAGRLIAQGVVNASSCPSGGLLSNGYADNCGLELAMPQVIIWQNQFDDQIMQAANDIKVPAQLLKNLFAQESQFWPGVFRQPKEFGLGQITDNGADALLIWNPSFFNQFCPLVLNQDQCSMGYLKLDVENQALLRGALATSADADCENCEFGIDLTNINTSINLVAHTMLADCEQVAQIVYNATGRIAGEVSSYEELWKFTIADYHVGSGCLSYAMYTSWAARATMDWEHVSTHLTEPCETVISYVTQVISTP